MKNIKIGRIAARVALVVAFTIAAGMPIVAFYYRGPENLETWTISAAALAVITSIIAAWSSRRVVELQEDAQRPYVYSAFDFKSRFGIVMLRVGNAGGTTAYNISLFWETQIIDHSGEDIGFAKNGNSAAITALLPGESVAKIIGIPSQFLKKHPDKEYKGSIFFEDISGRHYTVPFRLDGRPLNGTPNYDDEKVKTYYELQKIPKEIQKLRETILKLDRHKG